MARNKPDGGLLVTGGNPAVAESIGRLALYHRVPLLQATPPEARAC
jgi:hypothetical protein